MNSEDHKKVCYELNRIYDKKNKDYGDSFHKSWKDYGITMAAIRIGDKYNRLHSLVSRNATPLVGETVRDTLLDLANYAIMTIMEMDAEAPKWEKESAPTLDGSIKAQSFHGSTLSDALSTAVADGCVKTWEETLRGQKDVH